MTVPVILSQAPLPDQTRRRFDLAESLTVAEIVERALPGLTEADRAQLRVVLARGDEMAPVPSHLWGCVRPHSGTSVVIRVVASGPAAGVLGALLTQQVAGYVSTWVATNTALAGLSSFAVNALSAVAGLAVNFAGQRLFNSLVPVRQPKQLDAPEELYDIQGWRNTARPGEAVPYPLGRIRMAAQYAARPYSEIVDGERYLRSLFHFGYGPLRVEEPKIGDTPLANFEDVQSEFREGRPDDAPITLYQKQVIEDALQIPLDDDAPRNWTSARQTDVMSVIIGFPNGLFRVTDKGKVRTRSMRFRLEHRPEGGTWETVVEETWSAKKRRGFFRQVTWTLPYRGRWEARITRLSGPSDDTQISDTAIIEAVQSIRNRAPLSFGLPLALVALRVRASRQVNGTLDTFNAVVQRYARTCDGGTWSEGLSRNPASALLEVLTGPANPFPASDAEILWDEVEDWFQFCEGKGLKYDRGHETEESLDDAVKAIGAAGRASVRHDGTRWGVVIDRPSDLIVDHINPRNSSEFAMSRGFFDAPDAFRARFRDETNGWEESERVVRWPGYAGSVELTEDLPMFGKTDPVEVAREAYRRAQEIELRRDTFSVTQEGMVRVATRGDRVQLSHFVLDDNHVSARVSAVAGKLLRLDAVVTMQAGRSYGLRWREYDETDVIGWTRIAEVRTEPGVTSRLLITGAAVPPQGAQVHFGLLGEEDEACIVTGIEPGEDGRVRLTLVPYAPEIDTLTDAYTPAAWDGGYGEALDNTAAPQAPEIYDTQTIIPDDPFAAGAQTQLEVSLRMPAADTVTTALITLQHRDASVGGAFAQEVVSSSSGLAVLDYDMGVTVELVATATALGGEVGPASTLTVVVGSDTASAPAPINLESLVVAGDLGHSVIALANADPDVEQVRFFRVPDGDTLDTATHSIGTVSAPVGETVSLIDGDASRVTLLQNGELDAAAGWTAGGGWVISGGAATHTTGVASTLSQTVTLTAGRTYRGLVSVTGQTAGSLTVALEGGTAVASSPVTADGDWFFALDALAGNDRIELQASSDFDGAVSLVILFEESAACAPQGVFDYYAAAINADGLPSTPAGPVTTTII